MMDCQPYFALCIVHTSKVAPGNSKVGLSIDSLHVAGLGGREEEGEGGKGERRERREGGEGGEEWKER